MGGGGWSLTNESKGYSNSCNGSYVVMAAKEKERGWVRGLGQGAGSAE